MVRLPQLLFSVYDGKMSTENAAHEVFYELFMAYDVEKYAQVDGVLIQLKNRQVLPSEAFDDLIAMIK